MFNVTGASSYRQLAWEGDHSLCQCECEVGQTCLHRTGVGLRQVAFFEDSDRLSFSIRAQTPRYLYVAKIVKDDEVGESYRWQN